MIPTLDYCAEVDEEAEVSFVVKGSDISWPIESVMFTGADGQVYTSEPSDVSRYLQPVNPQHCRSPDQQKKTAVFTKQRYWESLFKAKYNLEKTYLGLENRQQY